MFVITDPQIARLIHRLCEETGLGIEALVTDALRLKEEDLVERRRLLTEEVARRFHVGL